MKILLFLISFLFFASLSYSQESIIFDIFTAKLENSILLVNDSNENIFYEHSFNNPSVTEYDLDEDGISELLVRDSRIFNGKHFYNIFIYNTIDSFYLVDSIVSGSFEPYETVSREIGSTIIISGNPECDKYNTGTYETYLPLNCWKYEGGEVFLINDEIYDLFITENEAIIEFLEEYFSSNIKNCNSTEQVKPAIAAAYINYMNAGEKSIASQILKKYYLCGDLEQFTQELNNISQTEDN